jgi:hypothetical protein
MIQVHGEDLQDADRFAGRPTQGGTDNFEQTPLAAGTHLEWMRLSRSGSRFVGYLSADGAEWQEIGSMDWGNDAPPTVMLGLAVCSHSGCGVATIEFDEIDISGGFGQEQPLALRGGTINWSGVSRDLLETSGVSYTLQKADYGNTGGATLDGRMGELTITGPNRAFLVGRQEGPIGIFEVAHDIGAPCLEGSTTYDGGTQTYTVAGSGTDIWTGGDQFQFAYSMVEGDFSMSAHVKNRVFAEGTRWGKVGIMARQDCSDRSRYTHVQTHGIDPQDGDRVAGRVTHGGADNFERGIEPGGVHHDWMRLDRVGNELIGFFSDDGANWVEAARHDWGADAPASVMLGLAVCAHSGCPITTIEFDQVRLTTGGEPPPTEFIRGDCDVNGILTGVGDAIFQLTVTFIGGVTPKCRAACDADGNGVINGVGDPIFNLTRTFIGGVTVKPPFPTCGPPSLPSDEILGCAESPACPN